MSWWNKKENKEPVVIKKLNPTLGLKQKTEFLKKSKIKNRGKK